MEQMLLDSHIVNKFPFFMESDGSLPFAKEPSTSPYPELNDYNLHGHILFL
jgi:hypothetical protein